MMSFFVGFAFFELGVFCGFFAASLMQAARTGEIVITVKEDTDGTGKELLCTGIFAEKSIDRNTVERGNELFQFREQDRDQSGH